MSIQNEWKQFIKENSKKENFTEEILSNLENANQLSERWIFELKLQLEENRIEFEELSKKRDELKKLNKNIDSDRIDEIIQILLLVK